MIASEQGLWESYSNSKEYSEWRRDIEISYVWDRMISRIYDYHISSQTTEERKLELEESLRQINLESRINRIELGSILENAIQRKVSARMLRPLKGSNHTYVIMPLSDKNWEAKESELKLRCIIARVENANTEKIIGIAIGRNSKGENHFDICYLRVPQLDEEFVKHAREIQDELGYFKNPVISHNKDFRK